MSEQTSELAKAALHQARPWRQGMPWWVVVLEGLIALGIGIYILTQPAAGGQIILIFGLYLLIINIERALLGFRDRIPSEILAARMLRAGIGLTIGLIIVFDAWQQFMTSPAPLVLLSLGWLLIGLVGLWEWMSAGKTLGLGLGGLILPVVSTLFGLLMLGSRLTLGGPLLQIIGVLATVAGVGLLGYGYMLSRSQSVTTVAAGGDRF